MFKNAVIALLATALLFTNTVLAGYGILAYLAVSAVVFVGVCSVEDIWDRHMDKMRRFERFKRTINRKITLDQPTKAS